MHALGLALRGGTLLLFPILFIQVILLIKLPGKPPTIDNVMERCYLGVVLLYGRLGYKCILFLVPFLWMKLLSVSYNEPL